MQKEDVISHKPTPKSIQDLQNLYEKGQLNLEPGFQRQSVWADRDRANLIDSILRNYPLPAIFLYKRQEGGHLVFDVIDGKQRLESIFKFIGAMRPKFETRTQLPSSDVIERVDWSFLKRKEQQYLITGYEIPVIEVNGDIGQIIDIFVRINSTGKALTKQEKRHARYYNSNFLKEAARVADRFKQYFQDMGVLSTGQLSRMKHVEIICELMLSLIQKDVLNKKTALDRVMATSSFDGRQLSKASRLVITTLNRIKRMFPKLRTTRLRKMSDFYSLAVLIGKYEQEGLILTNSHKNRLAWDLLSAFTVNVDAVSELQRKARGIRPEQELYRNYLLTVTQMTDDVGQRRKREEILNGILGSLFAKKDTQRGFSAEQRRIIWNSSPNRVCKVCGCKLTWDDFTVDHISPHSKGGKSQLDNAALMCRKHNSAKGNRRK